MNMQSDLKVPREHKQNERDEKNRRREEIKFNEMILAFYELNHREEGCKVRADDSSTNVCFL